MNPSYLYCLFAVAGFSGFYLVLGASQKRGGDPTGLNLVGCFVGAGLSLASACPLHAAAFPRGAVVTGLLIGSAAVFGFLGAIMALKSGVPVSVVNTILSLAMVVPVVMSMVVYHEVPHLKTLAGIILAGVSVYLVQGRKS
jgi:drug/metabolite transporter (DMT)-like permease